MSPQPKGAKVPILRLLVVLVAMLAGVAVATPANAAWNFNTSQIADEAETHPDGSDGGQCKPFVGHVVEALTGVYYSGYQQGWFNAGATEIVNPNSAIRGDIIQITPAESNDSTAVSMYDPSQKSKQLHTMIIREPRLINGSFKVIDSNFNGDEKVLRHTTNPYSWAEGSIIKIWRFGNAGGATSGGNIIRIKKSTFGSAEQVFTATKTKVFADWWVPGQTAVQSEIAVQNLPAGEEIVDIDKINQPDGVTQNLYIATTAGVREVWWNGSGYSNAALIITKTGIKRIATDLKYEGGGWTHRVYVLAGDGPYEYWWRDGVPVSNGYLLWNINNGIALIKSVALDGKDEVYVATTGETYRMKWPVNGGIQRKVVSTLADTVDIAKHVVGSTELLYTATKTGVHETWWTATSGFSNAAKIVTAPSGFVTVSIAKTMTSGYNQLYVAYKGSTTSRTYEYWWGPGSNGIQGSANPLWTFSSNTVVDIEKSTRGSMQYLYAAVGTTIYETYWGSGLFGTGTIANHG